MEELTMPKHQWMISIDAGGTFTDAIARRTDGQILEAKVASTPDDPAKGLGYAVTALEKAGVSLQDVTLVCHGTTVATNATLTGKLARSALVTTRGYRDLLGYRQSSRPEVYSLMPDRPKELVPRALRYEIDERLDYAGNALKAPSRDEILRLISQIRSDAPESIAVSFLFSYLNDDHERIVGQMLREELPGLPVTLSSEVAREYREYPRTATTAINAGLRPIVEGYLTRASEVLQANGVNAPLLVMQSNGGSVPASRAGREAHKLVLSGPAGGVAGLASLAVTLEEPNLISLDMGGTSTDICLLKDSTIPFTTVKVIEDHTLLAPTVDIHTIGAGGGSIAWVDQTGSLKVGPASAEAIPGPACYGRGGINPTLTDAHVVLGTLGTGELASGLTLNRALAIEAVKQIAEPLSMTVEEGAEAIIAVGLAHMIRALRKVSIERGLDPRNFSLVPFGGAGPLHAGLILRHMRLKSIIIPRRAGLFAADGLLVAGLRKDYSQTVLKRVHEDTFREIAEWYEKTFRESLKQFSQDGIQSERVTSEPTIDCRYLGQGYELTIPIKGWTLKNLKESSERFHSSHKDLYGFSNEKEPIEIVTIRLANTGIIDRSVQRVTDLTPVARPSQSVITTRFVRLPGYGETEVPVIDRSKLAAGVVFVGPAIIQQMDATSVILPDQRVRVASTFDLIVTDMKNSEEKDVRHA